eukprot:976854_1
MMSFQPASATFGNLTNVMHVCMLCHQPVCYHNAGRKIVTPPPNFVFPIVPPLLPNMMVPPPLFPPASQMPMPSHAANRSITPGMLVLTGSSNSCNHTGSAPAKNKKSTNPTSSKKISKKRTRQHDGESNSHTSMNIPKNSTKSSTKPNKYRYRQPQIFHRTSSDYLAYFEGDVDMDISEPENEMISISDSDSSSNDESTNNHVSANNLDGPNPQSGTLPGISHLSNTPSGSTCHTSINSSPENPQSSNAGTSTSQSRNGHASIHNRPSRSQSNNCPAIQQSGSTGPPNIQPPNAQAIIHNLPTSPHAAIATTTNIHGPSAYFPSGNTLPLYTQSINNGPPNIHNPLANSQSGFPLPTILSNWPQPRSTTALTNIHRPSTTTLPDRTLAPNINSSTLNQQSNGITGMPNSGRTVSIVSNKYMSGPPPLELPVFKSSNTDNSLPESPQSATPPTVSAVPSTVPAGPSTVSSVRSTVPAEPSTVAAGRLTVLAAPSDSLSEVDRSEPRSHKLEKLTKTNLRERLRKHIRGNRNDPKRVEWILDSLCSTHTCEELSILVMSRAARNRKVAALEPIWKKNRRAARWNLRVSIRKLIQGDKDWVDRVCNLIFGRMNNDEVATLIKSPTMQRIKIRDAEECLRNKDATNPKRKRLRKSKSRGKGKVVETVSQKSGSAPSESKSADSEPSGFIETELPVLTTKESICLCGVHIDKSWCAADFKNHEKGRKHTAAVARRIKFGGCDVYSVPYFSRKHGKTHMRSETHATNVVEGAQKTTAQSFHTKTTPEKTSQVDASQPTHPTVHSSNANCGETINEVAQRNSSQSILSGIASTEASQTNSSESSRPNRSPGPSESAEISRKTAMNSEQQNAKSSLSNQPCIKPGKSTLPSEKTVSKRLSFWTVKQRMNAPKKISILRKLRTDFPSVNFNYCEPSHFLLAVGLESVVNKCIGVIRGFRDEIVTDVFAQQKQTSKSSRQTAPLVKSSVPCGKNIAKATHNNASKTSRPSVLPPKSTLPPGKPVVKPTQTKSSQTSRPSVHPPKTTLPSGKTVSKTVSCPPYAMNVAKRAVISRKLRRTYRSLTIRFTSPNSILVEGLESDVEKSLGEVKKLMETDEHVVAKYVDIGSAREIMTEATKISILSKLSAGFLFVKFKYVECLYSFKATGFESDVDNCIGEIERLVGTITDVKAQQKTTPKSTRQTVPPSKSTVPCGKTVTKKVSFKDVGQHMNTIKKNSMFQKLRSAFRMVQFCYVDHTHCFMATGLESHVDECIEEIERLRSEIMTSTASSSIGTKRPATSVLQNIVKRPRVSSQKDAANMHRSSPKNLTSAAPSSSGIKRSAASIVTPATKRSRLTVLSQKDVASDHRTSPTKLGNSAQSDVMPSENVQNCTTPSSDTPMLSSSHSRSISSSSSDSFLTKMRTKLRRLHLEYFSASRNYKSLKEKSVEMEPEFMDARIDRLYKFGASWKTRHSEQRVAHAHHASRAASLAEGASQKRHQISGVESEIDALKKSLLKLKTSGEISVVSSSPLTREQSQNLAGVAVHTNSTTQSSRGLPKIHDSRSTHPDAPQNAVLSLSSAAAPSKQSRTNNTEPRSERQINFGVGQILEERIKRRHGTKTVLYCLES